jgi:hypothetical protein
MPFYSDATTLRIPNGPAIEVKHDQVVIWVSISPVGQVELPASSQRFPAVVDIGFNGSFLMREDHLEQWVQMQLDEERYPFLGTFKAYGHDVAAFIGNVWMHPNVPGFRDQIADTPPLRLEVSGGIAVCSGAMSQCRLPLLGMSALRKNRLSLLVNGEKKQISLRAPSADAALAEQGDTP